jgi:asparagine synthetase B (glutamine-hydrolysing)
MCGIAAVIHTKKFNASDATKIITTISYRGPDEQNVVEIGPCYPAHARLARALRTLLMSSTWLKTLAT